MRCTSFVLHLVLHKGFIFHIFFFFFFSFSLAKIVKTLHNMIKRNIVDINTSTAQRQFNKIVSVEAVEARVCWFVLSFYVHNKP